MERMGGQHGIFGRAREADRRLNACHARAMQSSREVAVWAGSSKPQAASPFSRFDSDWLAPICPQSQRAKLRFIMQSFHTFHPADRRSRHFGFLALVKHNRISPLEHAPT